MCSIRSCADAGTVCLRALFGCRGCGRPRFGSSGCFSGCSGRWVRRKIWKRYGTVMKELLAAYRRGVGGVAVHDNGLVWASAPGKAPYLDECAWQAVSPSCRGTGIGRNQRTLVQCRVLCPRAGFLFRRGRSSSASGKRGLSRIQNAFREMFWSGDDGYLADFVVLKGRMVDSSNMVVACGLDYKMLDEEQQASVLRIVGQHLLTPKGLRSLSPRNPRYKNRCEGNEAVRAEASMNGSVWVWPLWFLCQGFVRPRWS